MTPSVLLKSEAAIAQPMARDFIVPQKSTATLFATGLAGAEVVTIDLCCVVGEADLANEAHWIAYDTLTVEDPVAIIDAPGSFRVRVAASAGVVLVGAYGA